MDEHKDCAHYDIEPAVQIYFSYACKRRSCYVQANA